MKRVMIVAPHPDDETLGCGGTLIKHHKAGDSLHWLIVTDKSVESGASPEVISARNEDIARVRARYNFDSVHRLGFPETKIDALPFKQIVISFSNIIRESAPEVIYVPHSGDIHSDHRVTFNAVASCSKWFRYPSVVKILAYETLSETEFSIDPERQFNPNVFVNISEFLEEKIDIMSEYRSEVLDFPFPRSILAIKALAALRGSAAGCQAAEAFMLLKEIVQ